MANRGIGEVVKAASLWQPWASAIPLGLKRIETRHWKTNHRGPLAIHAAKRWTSGQRADWDRFKQHDPIIGLPLTFGQVIAVCNLIDIVPTEVLINFIGPTEERYGFYHPGRYGWLLADIQPLQRPFAYRGGQGIFNVPDDLIDAAR